MFHEPHTEKMPLICVCNMKNLTLSSPVALTNCGGHSPLPLDEQGECICNLVQAILDKQCNGTTCMLLESNSRESLLKSYSPDCNLIDFKRSYL